ncbi:MAG: hypothetical protein HYZ35_06060 [Chloroflexi bacterium]|nr:hypothetical protein [Chloroflexota bacterium]
MPAKLVVIGDSLSQGFASFAVTRVDESYGAILAGCLGLRPGEWRVPDFRGMGGLPFNLEWLASELAMAYGTDLTGFEWGAATFRIAGLMDQVEDYWERGAGSRPVAVSGPYHNLAVWGFKVADAYALTDQYCFDKTRNTADSFLSLPSEPMLRTALRVISPALRIDGQPQTQISRAREIAQTEGGIENLVVWLGTNNALGTVLELEIRETGKKPPPFESNYNLWSAEAFKAEYDQLVEQVLSLKARRVIVATVPHITIPPITRGVNKRGAALKPGERYYDYYTRFWIRDNEFNPARDPYLSKTQAARIDARIDAYNVIIKDAAKANRWCLVDMCDSLDRAAFRRNQGQPSYNFPKEIADLTTQLFQIDRTGNRLRGGLFSLDALHPTHSGYALVAHEFRQAMMAAYKLPMKPIDFAAERAKDSLVNHPPRTLDDVFGFIQTLESRFHFSQWLSLGAR